MRILKGFLLLKIGGKEREHETLDMITYEAYVVFLVLKFINNLARHTNCV